MFGQEIINDGWAEVEEEQKAGFWDDAEVISVYTRAQGIEDGVLVDVSELAREAGFKLPVAITAAVWGDVNDIPPAQQHQDVNGRLWDLLYMAFMAARANPGKRELVYKLTMHVGRKSLYYAKLHVGPGDDAEPVVTILQPSED